MTKKLFFKHKFLFSINILIILVFTFCLIFGMYILVFEFHAVIKLQWNKFLFWISIQFALGFICVFGWTLSDHLLFRLKHKIILDIRNKVGLKINQINYFNFNKNKSHVENTYIYDVNNYIELKVDNTFEIISTLFYITWSFTALFLLSWLFLVIGIVYVLIKFLISFLKRKKLQTYNKKISDIRENANHFVNDSASTFRRLFLMNQQKALLKINEQNMFDYSLQNAKKENLELFQRLLLYLSSILMISIYFFTIGYVVIKHGASIGVFVSVNTLFALLSNEASTLSRTFFALKGVKSIKAKINKIDAFSNRKKPLKLVNEIKLKNLGMSFNNVKLFTNLNFDFKPNEKILILGKSGTGKSTLLKLIMGIIKPSKGKVLWGNQKTNVDFTPQNITYIKNNPEFLFDNLNNNILLDKKENRQKISYVKQISKINFKQKVINKLSEGQKQRVEIATALYADSETIIFDEGFANVDKKTSKFIINKLLAIEDKQIFITSHHLDKNQIIEFDQIINLDNINN